MGLRPESSACPPLPSDDLRHILGHTRELWDSARGQSFFITGGTGFFGVWLLESLLFINAELGLDLRAVVLSRTPERFATKAPHVVADRAVELIKGDVRSFEYPEGDFRYVVHAATSVQTTNSSAERLSLLDEIVIGTRRVTDFASHANCQNLLLTSSGAVYGNQTIHSDGVREADEGNVESLRAESTYALSKRVAEHIGFLAGSDAKMAVKIARCFAFVGPHLPLTGHFAIGNFIRDVLMQRTVSVAGDGTAVRSYLYAADLVIWLWVILFRGPGGRAYNVGSQRKVSIGEMAENVRSTLGSPFEVTSARAPVADQPVNRYFPNTSRAFTELGLVEHITLEDAIKRTARWYSDSASVEPRA